jgi:hypothetical protein
MRPSGEKYLLQHQSEAIGPDVSAITLESSLRGCHSRFDRRSFLHPVRQVPRQQRRSDLPNVTIGKQSDLRGQPDLLRFRGRFRRCHDRKALRCRAYGSHQEWHRHFQSVRMGRRQQISHSSSRYDGQRHLESSTLWRLFRDGELTTALPQWEKAVSLLIQGRVICASF